MPLNYFKPDCTYSIPLLKVEKLSIQKQEALSIFLFQLLPQLKKMGVEVQLTETKVITEIRPGKG